MKGGDYMVTTAHKKGKVAPGKVNRNWRILKTVDEKLHEEAIRLGFGANGIATFLNTHFTRYFNGETINTSTAKRKPPSDP